MGQDRIEIDYDHVDVRRIMDQIKEKVAAEAGGRPLVSGGEAAPVREPDFTAGQGRMRRVLLKLTSPFRPLIKLLILPVDEEHRRTVLILDHANRRLDRLIAEVEKDRRITREYTKLLHHLCHNLVIELSKLKIEEETLKTKTRVMEKDFEFLGQREKALEKEVFK
jgi:hypothetical protein